MTEPTFFPDPGQHRLGDIAAWVGGTVSDADSNCVITSVGPLDEVGAGALTFIDNRKYLDRLATTRASACLVSPALASRVPSGVAPLVVAEPYRAWATILGRLYPAALRLIGPFGEDGTISPAAHIHPLARIEPGVTVEPGAVIGARAQIGSGTVVAANAVVGHDVAIGRDCYIGPHASVLHALVGNRVILHGGVRLGQDGFGFAMGARHQKVPQIGRVIVQDDVEIGANSCIDRGSNRDTVIGEGTKIDNLVQIGHNVVLGRHCIMVSQVGISGSTTMGDYVVAGGQAGFGGHLTIGSGAQVAGQSGVSGDLEPRAKVMGTPARAFSQFGREVAAVKRLAQRRGRDQDTDG